MKKFLKLATPLAALAFASRYLNIEPVVDDLWQKYKAPKGMEPDGKFNQTTLLNNFEKENNLGRIKGACVPITLKYALLTLKGQSIDENINIEKTLGKQFAYSHEQARQIITALQKETLKGEDGSEVNAEHEPPGNPRVVFRAPKPPDRGEPFHPIIMEAGLAAFKAFASARACKFTDGEKNIHINSVDVQDPVVGKLTEYLAKHSLKEGQALNYAFWDPVSGGHIVALVMKVNGEITYFDSNGPSKYKCKDKDLQKIGQSIEEHLTQRYPDAYNNPNSVKYVTSIVNRPYEASQIITREERDTISAQLQREDWDVETKPFNAEDTVQPLIVERDAGTQNISSLILETSDGKVRKINPNKISKDILDTMRVGQKTLIKPVLPLPPSEIAAETIPRSSIIMKHAQELFYARNLTKDEQTKIKKCMRETGRQKWAMSQLVLSNETPFNVRHVEHDEKGEIKTAIVEILDKKSDSFAVLWKLSGSEIPDDKKHEVKEGKEVTFAPNPREPTQTAKKARGTKR